MSDLSERISKLSPEKLALLMKKLKESEGKQATLPTIPRRKEREKAPLSFAQQRLWFLDQFESGNASYNVAALVRFKGLLDIDALKKSVEEIVRRHEILRASFREADEGPIQLISPEAKVEVPIIDLTDLPSEQQEEKITQFARQEARYRFDLTKGNLIRTTLFRLNDTEHVLILSLHHIVADGWSLGIFVREFSHFYRSLVSGKFLPLPELNIQYPDFAAWQREWFQGEVLEKQRSYWLEKLKEVPPVLELPTDRPRPPVQTFNGARIYFELEKPLYLALEELSRRENATLFMTLLAAFQILLYRYSGQTDICVGSPIANRNRADLEALIGFFVNTLVLRTDLSGNPTFRELLQRVRDTALGAYAHQDMPFEMLVDELQPERDLSHSPLFQVMFVLQNAPVAKLELPNLSLISEEIDSGTAKFDLTLSLEEGPDGLKGMMEYNTDLFDAATIERMLANFRELLHGIVANPKQRIAGLPLLTEEEKKKLLVEWNGAEIDYPLNLPFPALFEQQVERTPDATALVYETEQLTYAELNRRANRLAHYLQAQGIGPDRLVGVLMERSPDMVVALLATLKAGGAYVPLDPGYPVERIHFMAEDSGVSLILTREKLKKKFSFPGKKLISVDAEWAEIARFGEQNPLQPVLPDNLAYVIYTSGSTGKPKGTLVTHRGLTNYLNWCASAYPLEKGRGSVVHSSFSFDATVTALFAPLTSGGLVDLLPEGEEMEGLERALKQKADYSLIKITPAHLHILSQQISPREADALTHSFIIGGENLDAGQVSFWCRHAPNTLLVNEYGPTETVVGCVTYQIPPQWEGKGSVPIGKPIPNTEVYVLNEYLELAPVGAPGELFIGGVGVARGYLNRPDLTAEKFVPNPFSRKPGDRLYRSGDLVRYLPDGNLEFLGRIDFQVKIRGFRIELGEIESTLIQHPAVNEAVVLAREDRPGERRLVAYLVPEPGKDPEIETIRQYLRERLPDYMIPAWYIKMDSFPLTPNGKVDRKALPAPDEDHLEREVGYQAPHTPVEELLAGIWSEVLGVERIGVKDNFFNLGGHSLLATQVISRVRKAFGVELHLRDLFEFPELGAFAERIEQVGREKSEMAPPPLKPVSREGNLPLSFAQQRLWFLDQLEPGGFFYNIPSAIRLQGKLDLEAFEASLNDLVNRHESLRTTFASVEGIPVQVIAPELKMNLPVVDLEYLPENEREAETQRLAVEEAQKPFELDRGPLIRATLLRLAPEEHVLLLTIHHIVSDGWSMNVLVRDLAEFYKAHLAGHSPELPALSIQYADFAYWQQQWLQGSVLEKQLAYWKEKLAGSPPVLELPTDFPRPSVQTFRGATRSLKLPRALSDKVRKFSRQEGKTLFMILLAAFQTLLHRYSGQDDILVGSPISGRSYTELENLIGFFVNTLVLRTRFEEKPTFRQLLEQVKEVTLEAYAHQDLPFEKLVEELQPARDMSHSPLFQVAFIYENTLREPLELPGLKMGIVEFESGMAKYDLTLTVVEGEELTTYLEYNTDLYTASTIERMLTHFRNLLEELLENPDQPVVQVPMLTKTELKQILVEWNKTEAPFPEDVCVHEYFESLVEKHPDALAAMFSPALNDPQEPPVYLTYAGLNRKANQLARFLRRLGVGRDVLVGLSMERSPEMVIGILGILKAGGAFVPLDPAYPKDRLAYMIKDSGIPVLLTHQAVLERLPENAATVISLDSEWEQISREDDSNLEHWSAPENLAYVIYTSGSTGKPKGTMLQHRGLCNLAKAQQKAFEITGESRILQFSSLSFDASVWETVMALLNGATLCLAHQEDLVSGDGIREILRQNHITTVTLPPSVLAVVPETPLPELETIIVAGEKCSGELVDRWSEGRRFVNAYGPTETTVCASMHFCEGRYPQGPPIGFPIQNFELYILDRNLQPVPVGVPGELHISGVGLARGYLNLPNMTAEKFIPNPFSKHPGARMYKSGDLARYLPDGNIEFLGRVDFQVKVRGFRIELPEIEAVLSHYPSVRDVVVIVREDVPGDKRLVAYLVMEEGVTANVGEIRGYLREHLPEYMVPSAFVILDAMPLTPNGKVDRKALPAPKLDRAELGQEYVAPRTPTEEKLVEIVAEILHLDKVGVYDNFFELGGHSLLATQFMTKLRTAFQVDLPLRSIFESPTVADLAKIIDETKQSKAEELDKVSEALKMIKELSPEDIKALLKEKTS